MALINVKPHKKKQHQASHETKMVRNIFYFLTYNEHPSKGVVEVIV